MRRLANIYQLTIREFRTLWREAILLLLVLYSFGPDLYIESSAAGDMLHKASVTFVDEDRSALSRALQTSLLMPRYPPPLEASADQIDRMMDWGETVILPFLTGRDRRT